MDISTIKNMSKEFIKLLYICPNYRAILKILKDNKKSKIILFGTPAHGNLGDQAIAISELDFLYNISGSRTVVEIPMPLLKTHRKIIKKYISSNDVIIISGGGWMGNLWIHNEITIREIVSDYKKNKIVIFPQSLYYTNDIYGKKTLGDTRFIFSQHSNLILTVRDALSFECAKSKLRMKAGKNLFFCPDMVVYGTLAQKGINKIENNLAILCIRNDVEKKYDLAKVKEKLIKAGYTCKESTTLVKGLVPIRKRIQVVLSKIQEFQLASVVITDRLHAMLFALLAGTPCIAFDNKTGKVFGVGEYLNNNGMPVYLMDDSKLSSIEKMKVEKKEFLLTEELKNYFFNLEHIVNSKETF